MHFSAATSSLMAQRPIVRTARRTYSTSTSVAYSLSSSSTESTFLSFTSFTRMSSFSIFTYSGSLYLQKKTFTLCASSSGRFCTMRLMLRRATYCTSNVGDCASVMSGGASLRQKFATVSWFVRTSMYLQAGREWAGGARGLARAGARPHIMTILQAESTTEGFWCTRRGATRSTMFSASRGSAGV